MKKLILVSLLVILATLGVAAQAPTATVIYKFRLETALNVNTNYVQVVKVDNTVITSAALKPTCVQNAADVDCSIPVGTLASGTHIVSVSATFQSIEAVTTINNLNIGASAPKNATDFRYQIIINVP